MVLPGTKNFWKLGKAVLLRESLVVFYLVLDCEGCGDPEMSAVVLRHC